MTILHGDDRFYNNIFVQKWPAKPFVALRDSSEGADEENREVGTHVMDDYPTTTSGSRCSTWTTTTPDMAGLAPAHDHKLPVWCHGNAYFNGRARLEA